MPSQRLEEFLKDNSDAHYESRSISKAIVFEKYVIAACSNGCIEVYDSDLLSCLYSCGVCEYSGVKAMRMFKGTLLVLEEGGSLNAVKLV